MSTIVTNYTQLRQLLPTLRKRISASTDEVWDRVQKQVVDEWGEEIAKDLKLSKPLLRKAIQPKRLGRGRYENLYSVGPRPGPLSVRNFG